MNGLINLTVSFDSVVDTNIEFSSEIFTVKIIVDGAPYGAYLSSVIFISLVSLVATCSNN